MSLLCYECNLDLVPGEELPGREGYMIQPIVPGLVYIPTDTGLENELTPIPVDLSVAGCFSCMEKSNPEFPALRRVYEALDAETELERMNAVQHGGWRNVNERELFCAAADAFEAKAQDLPKGCLYCEEELPTTGPYFMFKALNRIAGSQNPSLWGSYQWSTIKTGRTGFGVCYDDFRTHLPRTYKQLSSTMRKKSNPDVRPPVMDFMVSSDFAETVERETGETVEQALIRMIGKGPGNIRIIRHDRPEEVDPDS